MHYFPAKYKELLVKNIYKMKGITFIAFIKTESEDSVTVKLMINDLVYLWLLGFGMGQDDMSLEIKSILPKLEESVDDHIKNATKPSEN